MRSRHGIASNEKIEKKLYVSLSTYLCKNLLSSWKYHRHQCKWSIHPLITNKLCYYHSSWLVWVKRNSYYHLYRAFTLFCMIWYFAKTALWISWFAWHIVKQSCSAFPVPTEHNGKLQHCALHLNLVCHILLNIVQEAHRFLWLPCSGRCRTMTSGMSSILLPTKVITNSCL